MSQPQYDRNLVFGLVAHHLDFITREQLLAAIRIWKSDKSAPIARILADEGAIAPKCRILLEPIVDEHIRQHDGNVGKSVESLRASELLTEAPVDEHGSAITLSRAHVSMSTAPPSGATGSTVPASMGASSRGRFRIIRSHAAGGLGDVFVAHDEELNRSVALKQIQARFAADALSRSRFLVEAEITGGLEHPGIVPVYGLGADDAGRPYYAMRFIRGDSLHDAIRRFHEADERSDRDPSERSLALRELLTRFVSVCLAIEYAHSRSVLHRDLKPSNIMLGKYGETLVVDWGLAKPVGKPLREPIVDETPLVPMGSDTSSQTQLGEAVGTPAFMSPEQAAGRVDEVGAASDVYGLAATLYMLLTGKPPFARDEREAEPRPVLERVKDGDFLRPSAVNRRVPPALEAICLKGMSRRAEDRYQSPKQLASDLENWLADEPVAAFQEPLAARLRRWAKRHRTLVSVALASLITSVIRLSAGLAAVHFEQQRTEAAWKEEGIRRKEADEQRSLAERSQQLMVDFFRSPDPELDGSKITVVEVLDRAVQSLMNDKDMDAQLLISLLNTISRTYSGLGLPDRATPILEKTRDLSRERFGANAEVSIYSLSQFGDALRESGRINESVRISEEALTRLRAIYGAQSINTARQMNNLAVALREADRPAEALPLLEDALRIHYDELGPRDRETGACMGSLAAVYLDVQQAERAIPYFEEALDVFRHTTGNDSPDTLITMNNLAAAYADVRRFSDAERLFKQAIDLYTSRYGDEHPAMLRCRQNLGKTYYDARRMPEALSILEDVHRRLRAKRGPSHPDTMAVVINLSEALWQVGRGHEATLMLAESLSMATSSLGPRHKLTLATAGNLGLAYLDSGQAEKALAIFEDLERTRSEVLGPNDPGTLSARHNRALCYSQLGRLSEAVELYEEGLKTAQRIFGVGHEETLVTQNNLAVAYQHSGRVGDAIRLLEDVLPRMRDTFGADDFDTLKAAMDLGRCHILQAQYAQAESILREAHEAWKQRDPEDWHVFALGSMLGESLEGLKRSDEAEPLLVSNAEELLRRIERIPPAQRTKYATSAINRVIRFYEARNRAEEANAWRERLSAIETTSQSEGAGE